jgi:hypothetical protein
MGRTHAFGGKQWMASLGLSEAQESEANAAGKAFWQISRDLDM